MKKLLFLLFFLPFCSQAQIIVTVAGGGTATPNGVPATTASIGLPYGVGMYNNGDLSFMEGGLQTVQETYIETELDEDFNTAEVEKTREVVVPGYSVYFTSTYHAPIFINKLIKKGILTQEQENFRFLFSPLLHTTNNRTSYQFYSGQQAPRTVESTRNQVIWTKEGTRYIFSIDSLNTNEIFGSLQIPVRRIFRRNKLI
jgi:hypothetical protein